MKVYSTHHNDDDGGDRCIIYHLCVPQHFPSTQTKRKQEILFFVGWLWLGAIRDLRSFGIRIKIPGMCGGFKIFYMNEWYGSVCPHIRKNECYGQNFRVSRERKIYRISTGWRQPTTWRHPKEKERRKLSTASSPSEAAFSPHYITTIDSARRSYVVA